MGLYIEELNGTAFTAPRGVSRSTWTYRIRPSAMHKPFKPRDPRLIRSGPFNEVPPSPNQLRWRAIPIPKDPTDFVDGIVTIGGNGDPAAQSGAAIHLYAANLSMRDRFFYNADGEFLIVPQSGAIVLHTEFGILDAPPGHVALIPRGIKFRVELPDGPARGFICENYGQHLRLPDLGPIGTFGLANARDFQAPAAGFEDREGAFGLIAKFGGGLWEAEIDHSPLDIVAWRGNYLPFRYRPLQVSVHQHGHLRPSGSVDLLRARVADVGARHIEHGVRMFPATMDCGRTHVPSTTVPQKRRE